MNNRKEFIEKIKSLTPTKDQVGMNNPAYAFGWVDAINTIAKLVTDEVSSVVSKCSTFISDSNTTSATKCKFCGKEKFEH